LFLSAVLQNKVDSDVDSIIPYQDATLKYDHTAKIALFDYAVQYKDEKEKFLLAAKKIRSTAGI